MFVYALFAAFLVCDLMMGAVTTFVLQAVTQTVRTTKKKGFLYHCVEHHQKKNQAKYDEIARQ